MKLQFRLRVSKNKIGQQEIQVVYNHGTAKPYRIEFGTGVHIYKNDFVLNKEKNKVRIYGETDTKKLNKILTVFTDIEKLRDEYWMSHGRGNNYPTPSVLKGLYEGIKTPQAINNILINEFQKWADGRDVREGSRKLFGTVKNDLKYVLGESFFLDIVNKGDLKRIRDYWLELKLADPTILKRWRTLKAFLVYNEDRIEGDWYKFKIEIKGYKNDKNLFALTKEEYDILMNYDFRTNKFTDNERYAIDLWLLSSNTGLRISDVRKVTKKGNMYLKNGEPWFRVTINKKDGEMITYPLSISTQKMLDRIDTSNTLSEQKIRDRLNDVFEKIKDDMPESWVEELQHWKMSGSQRLHEIKPKYKHLVFHSARKTFATVMIPILGAQTTAEIGGWEDMAVMLRRYAGKKGSENLKKYAEL